MFCLTGISLVQTISSRRQDHTDLAKDRTRERRTWRTCPKHTPVSPCRRRDGDGEGGEEGSGPPPASFGVELAASVDVRDEAGGVARHDEEDKHPEGVGRPGDKAAEVIDVGGCPGEDRVSEPFDNGVVGEVPKEGGLRPSHADPAAEGPSGSADTGATNAPSLRERREGAENPGRQVPSA